MTGLGKEEFNYPKSRISVPARLFLFVRNPWPSPASNQQTFPNASSPKSILLKILYFPLTRMVIGIAFFITVPTLINKWILKLVLREIIPAESG